MELPALPGLPPDRASVDELPCDPLLPGEGKLGDGIPGDGMPVLGLGMLGMEEPGEREPPVEGMLEELPPEEPPGIDGMPPPCEPDCPDEGLLRPGDPPDGDELPEDEDDEPPLGGDGIPDDDDCSFLQPANASPTASASAMLRRPTRDDAVLWILMTHVDLCWVYSGRRLSPAVHCGTGARSTVK